jgi:hypothetical protein
MLTSPQLLAGAHFQVKGGMRKSIAHTLTVKKLHEWLSGASSRALKDAVLKEGLRDTRTESTLKESLHLANL